jgi:hypothetical protein
LKNKFNVNKSTRTPAAFYLYSISLISYLKAKKKLIIALIEFVRDITSSKSSPDNAVLMCG